jgi:hypothetical protein
LREMNRSFELLCNFPFLMNPICKRTGVMRWDQYIFLLKKLTTKEDWVLIMNPHKEEGNTNVLWCSTQSGHSTGDT